MRKWLAISILWGVGAMFAYAQTWTPAGPWNSTTAYVAGNVVYYAGFSYLCTTGNTNVIPPSNTADWSLIGNISGGPGAAATVSVGPTYTSSPYSQASVTNTGTSSNAVLSFTIPQGGQAVFPTGSANQLLYYPSAGTTMSPLTLGSNLSITSGTLNATGGSSFPTGTTNQLLYYASNGTTLTPLNLGSNLSISGGALIASAASSQNFANLTSGMNTTATMTMGAGSSILDSGGTVQANEANLTAPTSNVTYYCGLYPVYGATISISFLADQNCNYTPAHTVGVQPIAATLWSQAFQASKWIEAYTSNTATASINYSSPFIGVVASYWNGSSGTPDEWSFSDILGSGTNPASTLTFAQTGSSGGASVSIPYPLAASNFIGPGTGLTGNASSLSIGGNAATSTMATNAANVGTTNAAGSSAYYLSFVPAAATGNQALYQNNSLSYIPSSAILSTSYFNAAQGFTIASGAPAGHYLRGNATAYVDSAIQASDLPILSGVTGSIGGSALLVNNCATGTATVTGATVGEHVYGITPATDPNGSTTQDYDWYGAVTASNTVTIKVCALVAGSPGATTYGFLVF